MITTLLEVSSTKEWMMHPPILNAIRMAMQENIAGHVVLSAEQVAKHQAYAVSMNANGEKVRFSMSSDEDDDVGCEPGKVEEERFVAIIPVCGPITRNGDACSYGSIDFRNMVMRASDREECNGIIAYINSAGGSAAAIPDYKYAIDYAHSKGKKVIAFVDGMCYSAAMYLAVLCDEIYYMNVKDGFGSIGVMAGFYTMLSGEKNAYTNETWNEIYATQSYRKNKWYRDAAKGDYEELQKDLDDTCDEFIADVKAHRPNVTDEHLDGATFDAKDVEGILNDGQSTIDEIVMRLLSEETTQASVSFDSTNTNTNINMENYTLINAACGLNAGEIAVKEDGAFMNAELLDSLEAHLSASEQKVADAEQKATEAENALAELQGKVSDLSAQLEAANSAKEVAENALTEANEAHSKELETLRNEHSEALAKKDEEIAALTTAKSEVDEELKGAKETIAAAEQKIADKDAQIAELTSDSGEELNAGAAPANNGDGAKVPTLRSFDPSKYKTNVERKEAFERFKRGEE